MLILRYYNIYHNIIKHAYIKCACGPMLGHLHVSSSRWESQGILCCRAKLKTVTAYLNFTAIGISRQYASEPLNMSTTN